MAVKYDVARDTSSAFTSPTVVASELDIPPHVDTPGNGTWVYGVRRYDDADPGNKSTWVLADAVTLGDLGPGWLVDGASNVGLAGVGSPTLDPGPTGALSPGTYEGYEWTTQPNISNGGITFKGCKITVQGSSQGFTIPSTGQVTFEDCNLVGPVPTSVSAYEVIRSFTSSAQVNIVRCDVTRGAIPLWLDGPAVVQHTHVHDVRGFSAGGGDNTHNECVTRRGGTSALELLDSRFDVSGAFITADVFIESADWSGCQQIANVALRRCLLENPQHYNIDLSCKWHPTTGCKTSFIDTTIIEDCRAGRPSPEGWRSVVGFNGAPTPQIQLTNSFRYDAGNPPTYAGAALT